MAGARHWPGAALNPAARRVGLLGGSFNPAHGGHRRVSLFAKDALGLDEVWWLVSPGNPLKPKVGMAPLSARLASARKQARGVPIRATAIEQQLGTVYTVDTLRALRRRYPKVRFVWLMGSDNLAQFHRWRDWRRITRIMPIAVIARPGYDAAGMTSPAAVWLGRYGLAAQNLGEPGGWRTPALIRLKFDPDTRSATAIRRADPHWAKRFAGRAVRDGVTRRVV